MSHGTSGRFSTRLSTCVRIIRIVQSVIKDESRAEGLEVVDGNVLQVTVAQSSREIVDKFSQESNTINL